MVTWAEEEIELKGGAKALAQMPVIVSASRSTGRNLIWATDDYTARGKIMDWNTGEPVEFRSIAESGGGHGK